MSLSVEKMVLREVDPTSQKKSILMSVLWLCVDREIFTDKCLVYFSKKKQSLVYYLFFIMYKSIETSVKILIMLSLGDDISRKFFPL